MRWALALVLVGCSSGTLEPGDAGPSTDTSPPPRDTAPRDAGQRWEQEGCEPVAECPRNGEARFCQSVHAYAGAEMARVAECPDWAWCPDTEGGCFTCLAWSSSPWAVYGAPDAGPEPDGGWACED